MSHLIVDDSQIEAGLVHLRACDPGWGPILDRAGQPPLRRRDGGFEGLAAIIVSQQLSVASAGAIWARLQTIIDPLTAENLALASDDDLRMAGLSRPKQRTLRALAAAVRDGGLDFAAFETADPETIRTAMTRVSGIGPWTADIYLLFCLGHADAFAPGDLALQEAARIGFGLAARPDPKTLDAMSHGWRPWRGVAARALWAYYAAVKTREGVG